MGQRYSSKDDVVDACVLTTTTMMWELELELLD
jgi:hypothetical protein